ncbi:uncharacterized protein LOC132538000 isoform X1 [Erinaceus europaeus]|uniref:Uncharacterized protein LOC132538000 isoform X1 n=1 Tax=Erinaceus europaeus TaxID=9365 RepID=A0ABM3X7U9_ERIEU|nr:uncharacterized protein LOC132538000 isoform X1 [Erinaceus europaeus]
MGSHHCAHLGATEWVSLPLGSPGRLPHLYSLPVKQDGYTSAWICCLGRKLRLRQAWPPAQGHTARNHGQPKQGEPRAPRTLAKLARCVAWKTLSERSPFLELCPTRHTAFCPDSRSPSSHLDLLPALSASSPKPGTRACIVFQGRLRTCLGPINTWSQRNAQGPSPVLSLTSLEWVGEPVGLQLLHRTRRLCLWVCVVGSPGNAYWLPRNHSQPQSQQDQSVELSPP